MPNSRFSAPHDMIGLSAAPGDFPLSSPEGCAPRILPMAKRKAVSIKDVARESGSSLTTVSLVLNKRDRRISEATRDRVLEAVQRLGYRPSRLAQGLQSQRTGFLAILVPQLRHAFADAYFGELISAIHDHARSAGYKVLLEVADEDFLSVRQHLELFDRHFVDGILCLGVTNRDTYLGDFEGNVAKAAAREQRSPAHPVVIVNNYLAGHRLNFVRCDYHQAGRMACEYLLKLGHRQIALIHGAAEVQTTHDYRAGIEEALADAGLKLPSQRIEDGFYTEEGGAEAAVKLMKRDKHVTAIITGNDKMAIGAISGLKQAGLRVPDDVSVIGCDDMHQAAFCDPPLTTVHTPIYELGERACECLLDLIQGKVGVVEETHPVTMSVRKSASAPRV